VSARILVTAVLLVSVAMLANAGAAPAAPAPAAPATSSGAAAADPEATREVPTVRDDSEVLAASEKWLAMIDTGKLGTAWDVSAKLLQQVVTRDDWIKGSGEARKPYGKLATRMRERFARTHKIPGAPDGDYAIIEFVATFANGTRATEQITWTLEPDGDGVWRVSGYYIR